MIGDVSLNIATFLSKMEIQVEKELPIFIQAPGFRTQITFSVSFIFDFQFWL